MRSVAEVADRVSRQELLDDFARRRIAFGPVAGRALHAHLLSATCGDEFTVHIRLSEPSTADARIEAFGWEGQGCQISTASASLLGATLPGITVGQFRSLIDRFRTIVRAGDEFEARAELEDAIAFAGLGLLPLRGTCALLPWSAAERALDDPTSEQTGVMSVERQGRAPLAV